MPEQIAIEMTINGQKIRTQADADKSLLNFLREDLGLTGVKNGCGTGHCGACTVILKWPCTTRLYGEAGSRQPRHGRDHRRAVKRWLPSSIAVYFH